MVDLNDMMLDVQVDVQVALRELQDEMVLPMLVSNYKKWWAGLEDQVKEAFKRENPDAYRKLMEVLGK
jgi:hypothetical protein